MLIIEATVKSILLLVIILGFSQFRFRTYKQEVDNPYGIVQSKIFGAPVFSGNLGSRVGELCKTIIKDSILDLGVANGVSIGASLDSAIGFIDGGLLIGLGADTGKMISTDMGNRLTEINNTSPDTVIYFGDPISALGFT